MLEAQADVLVAARRLLQGQVDVEADREAAKRAQVSALNKAGLSLAEYRWIRTQTYAALGMSIGDFDVSQAIEDFKEGRQPASPKDVTVGPSGPEANRAYKYFNAGISSTNRTFSGLPSIATIGFGSRPVRLRSGVPRPPASTPAVARFMSRLPSSGTAPEMALRRELHGRGLRFRVNVPGLPGRPDVALTRARVAVFVDGCFWHGCPDHFVLPRTNPAYWEEKIAGNTRRDRDTDTRLQEAGWLVLRFWEHQDPASCAETVGAAVSARKAQLARPRLDQ